jgi:hypothetical protein
MQELQIGGTRSISCWCPSIPKFANEGAAK